MEERRATQPHALTLEGRSRATVTGVAAVSSFNEEEIVLETPMGELALVGQGLRIEQLDLEHGQLSVVGEVTLLEYEEKRPKKEHHGFFRRGKGK